MVKYLIWLVSLLINLKLNKAKRGLFFSIHRQLFLLPLLFFSLSANSSSLDSLLHLLRDAKEDTSKVHLLDKIIDKSMHADPKKAMSYTKQQQQLVKKLNYPFGRYLVLYNYSECYYWFGQYEKMLECLKKNDKVIHKLKLKDQKGTQMLMYARYYNKTGQEEKSIKKFLQSIDFFRKIKNKKLEATALTSFAVFYTEINEHVKAKKYLLLSLKIHKERNNLNGVSIIYANLGKIYYYTNQIDSAQFFLEEGLKIQDKLNNRRSIANCKTNLGNIYLEKGYYDKALVLFKENYEDFLYLGDTSNMAVSYLLCADVFMATGRDVLALEYINKALLLLKTKNELSYSRYAYESLMLIYEKIGNYKEALRVNKEIFKIDSIVQEKEAVLRVKEIEKKYQTQKLEEQLRLVNEKNKVKDLRLMKSEADLKAGNYFQVALILVLVLVLFGVFFAYRNINLREQKKTAELEHIALRTQMNPHFIFNALNSIQRMYLDGDIQKANEFMGEFGELMRKILNNSSSNVITLKEEIEALNLYLSLEKIRCKGQFDYTIQIAEEIDSFTVLVPPLVIQPFVENAIWHGILPAKKIGIISVTITVENGKLKCVIADNGVGISDVNKRGNQSKGIQITEQRLRNKVNIISEKGIGTTVSIYINYKV